MLRVRTLTQEQARGVLRTVEALVSYGGHVDKIYIGLQTTFNCHSLGMGYSVSYRGCVEENYRTLAEFATAYKITWM